MLGWAPAQKLTHEQRQGLEDSGVSRADGIAATFPSFALNEGVLTHVAGCIKEATNYKSVDISFGLTRHGSIAQTAYVEKSVDPRPFTRNSRYCEGSVRAATVSQLDHRLAIGVRVMTYRLRKEADSNGRNDWCCYDLNRYQNVPDNWVNTRNASYVYGRVDVINVESKFTVFSEKERVRSMLIKASKVKK